MIVNNGVYKELTADDLLICAIGYEPRSWYLLEQNLATRNKENTLVFCLEKQRRAHCIFDKMQKEQIKVVECEYNSIADAKTQLLNFIQTYYVNSEKQAAHLDYSSMPRSWYCSFPLALNKSKNGDKKANFWYVPGDYPNKYSHYPSAGIDSISVFSGLVLPVINKKRFHIIGLGYDYIRTETMISIIEPDNLISCYAYNPLNSATKDSAFKANKRIIDRSLLSVSLPIDNFSGIVAKLCELVFDLTQSGQVVIVPDGPKPLIMAMSLLPDITNKNEVTCLHISRNSIHYNKINVRPREGEIYGFQLSF